MRSGAEFEYYAQKIIVRKDLLKAPRFATIVTQARCPTAKSQERLTHESKCSKTLIAAVVAGASTASGVVNAQLEEVIVTAERREASIQDTPISMQALTADQIEKRASSTSATCLCQRGVSGYEAPSSRGNMSLNIRGVGSGNSNSPSTDPAIGLYVDGVFIGKGIANGVDAIDLERIEILRGPQGTLYGRNSTGGAVNFVTKKPSSEGGVTFQASLGDYGYRAVKGRIDAPVGDSLAFSASIYKRQRDDLYDNTNAQVGGFENIDRDGYRWRRAGCRPIA